MLLPRDAFEKERTQKRKRKGEENWMGKYRLGNWRDDSVVKAMLGRGPESSSQHPQVRQFILICNSSSRRSDASGFQGHPVLEYTSSLKKSSS